MGYSLNGRMLCGDTGGRDCMLTVKSSRMQSSLSQWDCTKEIVQKCYGTWWFYWGKRLCMVIVDSYHGLEVYVSVHNLTEYL